MGEQGALRLFGRAAVADFRSATLWQIIALIAVFLWLAFEWGPGNEIAVPTLLMGLLNRIPGPEAIFIMPIAGFVLGFGLQLISGLIAAIGFSMLENTAQAAWTTLQRWRPDAESKTFLSLGWAARWGVAFFIGTTAVVLIQLFTTGEAKAARHIRAVLIVQASSAGPSAPSPSSWRWRSFLGGDTRPLSRTSTARSTFWPTRCSGSGCSPSAS